MLKILLQTTDWVPLMTAVAGISILFALWSFLARQQRNKIATESLSSTTKDEPTTTSAAATALAEALPDQVFFARHERYTASLSSYWSKQNQEILPECVVKPRDDEGVATAVRVIKREFDRCIAAGSEKGEATTVPTFAVRSGGHSTVPGASNAAGGIVLDLSLLNQISPAGDRNTVTIGCGARWGDVSRKLDSIGLAVAGGRNSDVGVGGLTLGGGYSYFSPQCGFVCDSVEEYRVVLASGEIIVASETDNHQLWRALKGGSSNFGIVTCFKIRAFPCTSVWSGFLYMFSWKAPAMLRAFYEFNKSEGAFDKYAGGPLLCISYVQAIGIQVMATHLMYTKPEPWPSCWKDFKSIGRIWSSTKIRSLTSTTDELDSISPAGFRQLHTSTTIRNDLATLEFAHQVYKEKIKRVRRVKGMVWTLVLQPLHSSTMSHGQHNVLGLYGRNSKDNLVVILFTAVWERESDDELVNNTGNEAIDEINRHAAGMGTADEFRYLNWCDGTQHPLQSYGEENVKSLEKASKTYDPDGFFQRGCVGGFKLTSGKA